MRTKSSERDLPANVERRGGAYVYRRVVPRVGMTRHNLGRKHFLKTWSEGTPLHLVNAEAEALRARHELLINQAKAGVVFDPDIIKRGEADAKGLIAARQANKLLLLHADWMERGFAMEDDPQAAVTLNALSHGGKYTPAAPALTIKAAYAIDAQRHKVNTKTGRPRDEGAVKLAIDSFVAVVGDIDVLQGVRKSHVLQWIDKKRAAGLTDASIRRQANSLQGVIGRALRAHEIERSNPFADLGDVLDGKHRKTDKLPFHTSHLALIDAALPNMRPDVRNILTMMKYTGAGNAEIGGLLVVNVKLDDPIPHIWIKDNAIRGMKTGDVRERKIPLIGPALDAARDAVERAKGNEGGKLFKGFTTSANSISAALSNALREAGIPKSRRLTAYSLRHSLTQALRDSGCGDWLENAICGHAGGSDSHSRYGSAQAMLGAMRDALEKAVPFLGKVALDDFRPEELV